MKFPSVILLLASINAALGAVTTLQVTATAGSDLASSTDSPITDSDNDSALNTEELETTVYSTKTSTKADGDIVTTIQGSVSTYYSTGYSQSIVTYTTSVPVTSTYTSKGDNTVVIITTFTQAQRTTSCVTSVETSMIVSTVSTERITLVSCADKKCQSTFTSTYLGQTDSDNGIRTISTLTGSELPTGVANTDTDSDTQTDSDTDSTSLQSGAALITLSSNSNGKSTLYVTKTSNSDVSGSQSASVTESRGQTLTFQDGAVSRHLRSFSLTSILAVLGLMLIWTSLNFVLFFSYFLFSLAIVFLHLHLFGPFSVLFNFFSLYPFHSIVSCFLFCLLFVLSH